MDISKETKTSQLTVNGLPFVSEDEQTFMHDKYNEEYAIERIREKIASILSKHDISRFSEDLKKILRLQSCIDELQAIVNKKRGIAFKNKFGGDSYSEANLEMINKIYDDFTKESELKSSGRSL